MNKRQKLGAFGLALLGASVPWISGRAGLAPALAAPAQTEKPAAQAQQAPKREPDVIFVPTPEETVDGMLKLADVKKGEMVYDLGCGDGRIVIAAAQKYGARGIGVDIDPQRIKESNQNAQTAKVTDRVKFLQQDLFAMDFKDADVITLYLLPQLNVKLRPKLLQLRPGTRIVSHAFDMGEWKPDQTAEPGGRSVYFWRVPAQVAGTWQVTLPGAAGQQNQTLQLKQQFQNVSGSLRMGDQTLAVSNGKLSGDQIRFTLTSQGQGQKRTMRMTGRVSGDSIQGTMESEGGTAPGKGAWTAKRTEKAAPTGSTS